MAKYNTLKERQVLQFRVGWNNIERMSLKQIGEIYGVTGAKIRDIESMAIRKIRRTPWGR